MAAELRDAFPHADVRLIQSSGGVFEVDVDGHRVFSKKTTKRHAEPGEVLRLIRGAAGPNTPSSKR
ncbi:MAG: hypothetical protein DMD38_02190 [Gemmatimonadetes bacterium]|nr:MAG: hypothetical protein AUI09_04825 [Gemmatimonadetes bacterium 13_2_20CM_2_66_5]OLC87111.1 MAG: hypothetical protein AUI86_07620 [Gemmatimonadetes bacterium 13_1_40CM_3_66_12]OLD85516.1 MAG: hypothetical protein AUG85_13070 [Gemmatimonadetes bacterium 13_1_20CM_4_66_11]PYP98219.1 MAG: hypothetical protein DMD38_02190 [Gemmatimonadota bacterium]